jgi:hypothetical protein
MLKIGDKKIPINEALVLYRNKKQCKRHFDITSKEYNKLISKLLKYSQEPTERSVNDTSKPNPIPKPNQVSQPPISSSQPPISSSQPPISSSQPPSHQPLQVSSYDTDRSYSHLNDFDNHILPSSYAPIISTSHMSQQLLDSGRGQEPHDYRMSPMQAADNCDQPLNTDVKNHTETNRNLLDRRFFAGYSQSPSTVVPLRFNDSLSQSPQQSQNHPDHKIFSRTFDLAHKSMPDLTMDRQSVGCRRAQWEKLQD